MSARDAALAARLEALRGPLDEEGREAVLDLLSDYALAEGATATSRFAAADMRLRDEVRDMCAADRCQQYGRNWMCPPAVGSLDEWRAKLAPYTRGLMIQFTCQLEDSFDFEAMEEGSQRIKGLFNRMVRLGCRPPLLQPLTAGTCQLCKQCSYPDAPCRHPQLAYPSLEAVGILVTQLCESAGLPYYYGENTLTYSGAILV